MSCRSCRCDTLHACVAMTEDERLLMQTHPHASSQEALTLAIHRSEIVWDKLSLAGSRMIRGLSDEQGRQDKMLGGECRTCSTSSCPSSVLAGATRLFQLNWQVGCCVSISCPVLRHTLPLVTSQQSSSREAHFRLTHTSRSHPVPETSHSPTNNRGCTQHARHVWLVSLGLEDC